MSIRQFPEYLYARLLIVKTNIQVWIKKIYGSFQIRAALNVQKELCSIGMGEQVEQSKRGSDSLDIIKQVRRCIVYID